MTHDSFLKLIFLTVPYLNYIRNKSRVRNIIILEIMVPITIRYLAGGIILDLNFFMAPTGPGATSFVIK